MFSWDVRFGPKVYALKKKEISWGNRNGHVFMAVRPNTRVTSVDKGKLLSTNCYIPLGPIVRKERKTGGNIQKAS